MLVFFSKPDYSSVARLSWKDADRIWMDPLPVPFLLFGFRVATSHGEDVNRLLAVSPSFVGVVSLINCLFLDFSTWSQEQRQ